MRIDEHDYLCTCDECLGPGVQMPGAGQLQQRQGEAATDIDERPPSRQQFRAGRRRRPSPSYANHGGRQ